MSQKAEADPGSVARDPGTRATRLGPRMVPLDDLLPLSLLKSPSGLKVTQRRARVAAQSTAGQAETSRVWSGVTSPGIDRAEN